MGPVAAATLKLPRLRAGAPAGERPDFAEVAHEHLDAVHRYVSQLVRDRDAAEDLTAAAFERALRRWDRYDPARGRPEVWLCGIARNLVLDHWRRERRLRRLQETLGQRAAAVAAPADNSAGLTGLAGALGVLSDAEREVIALRVLLDMSCDEAAAVMGTSATSCSTALHRALSKLRKEVPAGA